MSVSRGGGSTMPTFPLFLGNLSMFIGEEDIELLFSKYIFDSETEHNNIEAKIIRTEKGVSLGYGFITIRSEVEAEAAMRALNGKQFHGRPLQINWAVKNIKKTPPNTAEDFEIINSVHVKFSTLNRGHLVTEETLLHHFAQFGSVIDVFVKYSCFNKITGLQKGYAFVHYDPSPAGKLSAIVAAAEVTGNAFVKFECQVSNNLLKHLDIESDKLKEINGLKERNEIKETQIKTGNDSNDGNNLKLQIVIPDRVNIQNALKLDSGFGSVSASNFHLETATQQNRISRTVFGTDIPLTLKLSSNKSSTTDHTLLPFMSIPMKGYDTSASGTRHRNEISYGGKGPGSVPGFGPGFARPSPSGSMRSHPVTYGTKSPYAHLNSPQSTQSPKSSQSSQHGTTHSSAHNATNSSAQAASQSQSQSSSYGNTQPTPSNPDYFSPLAGTTAAYGTHHSGQFGDIFSSNGYVIAPLHPQHLSQHQTQEDMYQYTQQQQQQAQVLIQQQQQQQQQLYQYNNNDIYQNREGHYLYSPHETFPSGTSQQPMPEAIFIPRYQQDEVSNHMYPSPTGQQGGSQGVHGSQGISMNDINNMNINNNNINNMGYSVNMGYDQGSLPQQMIYPSPGMDAMGYNNMGNTMAMPYGFVDPTRNLSTFPVAYSYTDSASSETDISSTYDFSTYAHGSGTYANSSNSPYSFTNNFASQRNQSRERHNK